MEILERNLQRIYDRLMQIADDHYYFNTENALPLSDEEKM